MKKALALAKKAGSQAVPNPMVGAILVKNKKIIGQGYHKKSGGPHAEVEAFRDCKEDPKGSTLYVTLEPCSHYGKTPPCTDLIIKKGVKKVICCSHDPNPKVKGLKKLKEAGIETHSEILKEEALKLNKVFFKTQKTGLPFITLKIASSIDFKIWSPTNSKITGKESLKLVHKLRTQSTGILVGINTILKDDPILNVRGIKGPNPIKIILDSHLRIPLKAKTLKQGQTIICTTVKNSPKRTKIEKLGIKVLSFPTLYKLKPILEKLTSLGQTNILIEGGQTISSSFLKQDLADELFLFIADKKLGTTGLEAINSSTISNLQLTNVSFSGKDTLLQFAV